VRVRKGDLYSTNCLHLHALTFFLFFTKHGAITALW
jgi:hypothetical protein